MKVFIVERNDVIGYDEVDSMVVVAGNEECALALARTANWGDWRFDEGAIRIAPVDMARPHVVLSSFNSG